MAGTDIFLEGIMRRETNGHEPLQSGKTTRGSPDAMPSSTPKDKPNTAFQTGTATTPVVLHNLIAATTVPFIGATKNKIILAKNRDKNTTGTEAPTAPARTTLR